MSSVRTNPIDRNPDIEGGDPVFAGTRVPIRRLFEYLETGANLDDFVEGFPTVEREQAVQVLVLVRERLLKQLV